MSFDLDEFFFSFSAYSDSSSTHSYSDEQTGYGNKMRSIMDQAINTNPVASTFPRRRCLATFTVPRHSNGGYLIAVIGPESLSGPSEPQLILSVEINLNRDDPGSYIEINTDPTRKSPTEKFSVGEFDQAALRVCGYINAWNPQGQSPSSKTMH